MISTLSPFLALLLSVALLLMGNGLQGTLLPIRAAIESFSTIEIGVLGSSYFLGFAAGCILGPRLVRRAGHVRAFTGIVAVASTTALAHVLILDAYVWWLFRGLTGFCFAALFMIIESWLNESSTNETRGMVFSVYTIINLTVMTIGQMMMTLYDPSTFPLFCLASILVSLAAVPVALTTAAQPAPISDVRLRVGRLFTLSPVGFAGSLAVGLGNGAFWSLAPIFAQQRGMDIRGVALFMSVTVIAGAIGQWPLGRTSDRMDRRKIIILACLASAVAGLAMALFGSYLGTWLLVVSFFYGAFAFPIYSLSVAHTNDFTAPTDYVETASGLLLVYALGAVVGPMIASAIMSSAGPTGLFGFTAMVHVLLAAFTVYRMSIRLSPETDQRRDFTETLVDVQVVSPIETGSGASEQAEGLR